MYFYPKLQGNFCNRPCVKSWGIWDSFRTFITCIKLDYINLLKSEGLQPCWVRYSSSYHANWCYLSFEGLTQKWKLWFVWKFSWAEWLTDIMSGLEYVDIIWKTFCTLCSTICSNLYQHPYNGSHKHQLPSTGYELGVGDLSQGNAGSGTF